MEHFLPQTLFLVRIELNCVFIHGPWTTEVVQIWSWNLSEMYVLFETVVFHFHVASDLRGKNVVKELHFSCYIF